MAKTVKNNIAGSEFWVNSDELTFSEILTGSRIPSKWSRFDFIYDQCANMIVKPVNGYVLNLYPKPELILINNNTVRLRQKTHAEIWVKPRKDDALYALDKTWQRQFYPSKNIFTDDSCFLATYRFYMPWIIDQNINARIEQVLDEDTCFVIDPTIINFTQLEKVDILETHFIDFKIKKEGSHMYEGDNTEYGIIGIGTPMYDIVFEINEKDIEVLREQYR